MYLCRHVNVIRRPVNVCHGFVPSCFRYFCHSNVFHAHACHAIMCHAIVTSCKCLSCKRGHVNERPTSASSCVPSWLPERISLYKNAENRGKCKLWNHCKIPEIIIWESPSYFRLFLMPGWITFSTNLSIVPFICPGNTIIIFIIINPHNNTLLKKTPRWAMGIHGISWKSRFPFLICIFHEPIVEMAWWSTLERFSRVEKAFL